MKKKLSLAILLLSVAVNAQELIKRTFITPSLPPVETKSSQTLLWDQNPGTIPPPDLELISIPITHSNVDDKALWYADDFKLSSASEITKIKIFGITYDPNDFINNNLTGVDLYIYANSNDNIPSSNPSEVGTGLLEIINLDPASSALEIEDDNGLGTGVVNFTFDIEEHNGSSFHLPEGTYWISFFPRLDNLSYVDFGDEEALKVWTTMGPDPDITNTLSHGQVMDKDMVLTDNYTTWTSVLEASDNEVENFAFTIEGNPLLSVDVSIIWLGKQGQTTPMAQYVVHIRSAVNGLSDGSTVRYMGVDAGWVVDIILHTDAEPYVEVLIELDDFLPVNETTYATLVIQGVTGIGNIDLASDPENARPLRRNGAGVPVIPFRSSGLSAVLAGGGDITSAARRLLSQMNQLDRRGQPRKRS